MVEIMVKVRGGKVKVIEKRRVYSGEEAVDRLRVLACCCFLVDLHLMDIK